MMALSGQALTQAMQPTHFSASKGRDQRRKRGEVAGAGGGGGDEAAPYALVGRKLDVGDAAAIGIDDGRVEVVDVRLDVETLRAR
jgi:hypothetical protein